jgi:hypothetical protein
MRRPSAASIMLLTALIGIGACGNRSQVRTGPPQVQAGGPTSVPSPAVPSPAVHPRVLIYGDSLAVQTKTAVRFLYPHQDVVFRAVNGAKMCDLAPEAAADRRSIKPTRVVLAFTGNTWGCAVPPGVLVGTLTQVVANYERNLRLFARSFQGIPITVVGPPAMKTPGTEGIFPYNGSPGLIAMYQRVSAELGLHFSSLASDSLTPGHVYTAYRPARGTTAPLVRVRDRDGIHLAAAGEVYYAIALMTP